MIKIRGCNASLFLMEVVCFGIVGMLFESFVDSMKVFLVFFEVFCGVIIR